MNSKVAIIMPVYNAEKTIIRSISSVLSQTYTNWRLYIIDDCSDDDSAKIINTYLNDGRIIFTKLEKNLGAAEARNVGLKISEEDYISFIDSDDEWLPKKLELQMRVLSGNKGFSLTNYIYQTEDSIKNVSLNRKFNLEDFLKKKKKVCFPTLLFFRVEGLYFENLGHEDFFFIYCLYQYYNNCLIIDELTVRCHDTSGSLSSNKYKSAIWHFNLLKKIYPKNRFRQLYFFSYYIYNGLKFRLSIK
ncbi:glycosyltransferase family 2 protein [Rosenbergiella epipactidis]|uniref:glycosyltransferase family 2 protein n=1 Tax=Rosenbergiella epipactidis TaxID=1544694 RepID=UPI00202652D4|nr:glycosyltransferase family 2 protein [Rosenbergiella epipactidis]MCL9667437.1 glycosyltransferase family 2 protein [Rosenbergiella epipactidis]